MSVTDLIAEQLTVIRNGIMSGKKNVIIKKSKIILGIIDIIKREGFISDYQLMDDNKQGKIKVYLKVSSDGSPSMDHLEKVSTPGRRVYIPADEVEGVRGNVGISILSTSKGLLTNEEATREGVGGELICRVW